MLAFPKIGRPLTLFLTLSLSAEGSPRKVLYKNRQTGIFLIGIGTE
jgi:hypothetical protein